MVQVNFMPVYVLMFMPVKAHIYMYIYVCQGGMPFSMVQSIKC